MFNGLAILGLIGLATQFFKEATSPKMPPNARIDWELYWAEDLLGVSYKERGRRMARGYYHTTEPMKMFDLKKYNEDVLSGMSPDELERRRLSGVYGAEKPKGYDFKKNFDTKGLPRDYVLDVERYEYARRKYPEWFRPHRLLNSSYNYRIDPSVYRQYM